MIYLWGIMKIVGFTNISNNFHDSRNYGSPEVFPEWLKMLVSPILSAGTYFKTVLTVTETCDSADLTYSCEVFCKQAGKVFASLKKLTSCSNTKLGNNLHLQTLLWEHQFMFLSVYHVQSYTPCLRFKNFNIGKLLLHEHAHTGLVTHFLR